MHNEWWAIYLFTVSRAMERICPRCGRTSSEVEFVGNLCKDCYVEMYGVARLPNRISYVFCRYCGRYKYQGGWNEPSGSVEETLREYIEMIVLRKGRPSRDVEEFWVEGVRFDRDFVGAGIYRAIIDVAGRSGSVILREAKIVEVKVDMAVCPDCTNRITKRGYNAIIQVRSNSGRLSKELRSRVEGFLAEELSWVLKSTIIGTEDHREGFDLLIADPSSARMIASKLRHAFLGRTVETWKLVGRKQDGSRKGRLTILVRIPDIEAGDLIEINGRPYMYLASTGRGSALLVDLRSGREITTRPDFLWESGFKRYDASSNTRVFMLIGKGRNKLIFLDEDAGYETVEAPLSKSRIMVEKLEQGARYKVIIVGDRFYVVDRVDEPLD